MEKILRRHFIRDGFNPFFNERPSLSMWPEASSTMRTLALGKLFPQLTMPLSPANLLDSSGDWLTPFFHIFCFFSSSSFERNHSQTVAIKWLVNRTAYPSQAIRLSRDRKRVRERKRVGFVCRWIDISIDPDIYLFNWDKGFRFVSHILCERNHRMFKWRMWYSIFVLCFLTISKYDYFVTVWLFEQ